MLIKQKKVSDLVTGDLIFGVERYKNNVHYNIFRVLEFKENEKDVSQLQIKITQKALFNNNTDDEIANLESELVLFKNSDVLVASNSTVLLTKAFVIGVVLTGLTFGLTYTYFLNCY